MNRNRIAAVSTFFGLLTVTVTPTTVRAQFNVQVILGGLANPRDLAFDNNGNLYVAEAGSGGPTTNPTFVDGGGTTVYYGATGGVTRISANGSSARVINNLPSLGPDANSTTNQPAGTGATGLQGISFDSAGNAYGIIGWGADPALRAGFGNTTLGSVGGNFGQLVNLNFTTGTATNRTDIAAIESATNPDGADINSNSYRLRSLSGGGFLVADAGGNDLLNVSSSGAVSLLTTLPTVANPLFDPTKPQFGGPTYQAVPTSVVVGSDGNDYIGTLSGYPFPAGGASIYRYNPITKTTTVAYSGFTNIVDMTFGADNALYVLEVSANGLGPASPSAVPGALVRVDTGTGVKTVQTISGLFGPGLVFPTSITARGNDFYITNNGTSPTGGQVIRISTAPEASAFTLVGIGMIGLATTLLRRKRG